jgi:uncharacterized protein YbjT (DUF2867 family)
MKVLATGATGAYAGLVVPALVRHGLEVRAMVHDPTKADAARRHGAAETVPADLGDPVSLKNALDGVDGVFLITPAFHPDAVQLGLNMVDAAVAAGISKIVYNGVYHPSLSLLNHATTRPVEEALYASGLDFVVLQPAMYVQALAATYHQALSTGVVLAPWSKRSKMTYVDYRDVADSVAIAFTDRRLSRGTFELAAGGMIDRVEIAELMSLAAGKTVAAEDLPDGAPLPPDAPEALAMMFQDYSRHGFQGGNPLVLQTILRREPRSVAAFIAELSTA